MNSQQDETLTAARQKEARLEEAQEVFRRYPDAVSKRHQAKVLAQVVDVGMDPYMAKLAAGPCSYKISADPEKWHASANPEVIMDAQSLHPDKSKIWLRFRNDTQYPEAGMTTFVVFITEGRVVSIESERVLP